MSKIHAHTDEYSTLERQLTTFARFRGYVPPEDEATAAAPDDEFKGIWDTGATDTVISKRMAEQLGLKPYRITTAATASNVIECPVYVVSIFLPLHIFLFNMPVTAMDFPEHDLDFLLGMDIIQKGDFAVTHANCRTKLTFQIPSTHNIDFRREIDDGCPTLP